MKQPTHFTIYRFPFAINHLFFIVLGFALTLTAISPVYAHAELVRQEPEPGAEMTVPPTEIRLTFNEPITADSTITLSTGQFQAVAGVIPQFDPQTPEQMVAPLPELAPGTYTVQWTAVSADGHPVTGSYTFTVVDATNPTGLLPAWWLVALAGVLLMLLALLWRRRQTQNKSSTIH